MDKILNSNFVKVMIVLLLPSLSLAQKGEDPWGGDIEPPPTPIDQSIVYLIIAAIVLAGFISYRRNYKLLQK